MVAPLSIRQFYSPLQPVMEPAVPVSYNEYLPSSGLLPYIYCYWHLKTREPLDREFSYRVIADGCMDIFFELHSPEKNFVMGFCREHTEFPLGNVFYYVGVRFLPGMFPLLFKVNAAELSDRFEQLHAVLPATARFIAEAIHSDLHPGQVNELFNQHFLSRLSEVQPAGDPRIAAAIVALLENKGALHIEKDLDTGISPRQLRRLFHYYVGDTPKIFSKVIRFQHFLRSLPLAGRSGKTKLFYDAGYYDQSHFIKEFRNFYGMTPGQVFQTNAGIPRS